ncbi:MAG: DUF1616 domain-containing protein [Methanoregula sp.]|nr:DUF1616 domain-containing protein [Methanoregula sp.]
MSEKTPGTAGYTALSRADGFLDLILTGIWLAAGILTIYLPPLNETLVRFLFTLPLMLFIPGYCAIAALFPNDGDLTFIERIVLSIGLSIIVVPLICFGLNFTPWGIRLDPVVLSLTLFSLVTLIIAWYRRSLLPVPERYRVPFSGIAGGIREELFPADTSRTERFLSAFLSVTILLLVLVTIYVLTVPLPGDQFTEFFILGENRTAADYPDLTHPGQENTMYVGVANHEYRDVTYTIETWMLRTEFDNVTNTSRIKVMDPHERMSITLGHNEKTIIPYNLSYNKTGYNRVEFLLFGDEVPGYDVNGSARINASYRELHLRVINE